MRTITLSADEKLIEKAEDVAKARQTTLTHLFQEWLVTFTETPGNASKAAFLHQRLDYARAGRTFTREEMNER